MPSVTLIPNSYTNTGSYNFTQSTSYPITRAYNNADHTDNYARLTLASNKNSSRTSTMYLEFDKSDLENIPSSSTIGTITANVRYGINNTTYVSAVSIQLHADTTAKGSAVTTRSTTSATSGGAKYSITPGSWTLSELENIRLYISATHNKSTSSGYIYLYGADVTVNYTLPASYTISASSTASGVTVTPASQTVYQGESASVTLNKNTNIVVTDNSVDVTSQLVRTQEQGTQEKIPNACVESTFTTDSSYPTSNGLSDTSSTSYARFKLASTQYHATYSFDTSAIPTTATIVSVACSVKAYVTSTSSNISVKKAQLYASSTAKGSADTLPTTLSTWDITTPGDWTATEVRNIRLRFDGTYSGSSSYYIQFYGAELTIVYTLDSYVYVYTISNVTTGHTILVSSSGGSDIPFRVKQNGSWVTPDKVMAKTGGVWKEAVKIFVKQNGSWTQVM